MRAQLLVISPGMSNCWLRGGQKVTLANPRPYVKRQLVLGDVSVKVSECVPADPLTHACELRTCLLHGVEEVRDLRECSAPPVKPKCMLGGLQL